MLIFVLFSSSGYSSGPAGVGGTGGTGGGGGGASSELTASSTLAPHSRPAQYQPGSSPLTSSPAANILPPSPMVRPLSLTSPDLTLFLFADEGIDQIINLLSEVD